MVTKGNGALQSTIAGNARGNNAIDWQMTRTNVANVASGNNAAIPGGQDNQATGNSSFAMGNTSAATGTSSTALGQSGVASGNTGVVLGFGAFDDGNYSQLEHASHYRTAAGDFSQGWFELQNVSGANTTPVVLTRNGNSASGVNQINLTASTSLMCKVTVHAFDATSTTTAKTNYVVWDCVFIVNRDAASVIAVAGQTAPSILFSGGTGSTAALAIGTDSSNNAAKVTFTPPTSNTAIWKIGARVNALKQK